MSSHARSDHIRRIMLFLEVSGAKDVRIEVGKTHPKIYFAFDGARHMLVVPGSPRNAYRTVANSISTARKLMMGTGL